LLFPDKTIPSFRWLHGGRLSKIRLNILSMYVFANGECFYNSRIVSHNRKIHLKSFIIH
jgi:hypothetical protein